MLLFHFGFTEGALANRQFWATPGGAVEDGESYREAARRELLEETGIDADVGYQVAQRDVVFQTPTGEFVAADERYFLVRVTENRVNTSGQGISERRDMADHKWWSLGDLKMTNEMVFPENLILMLEELQVRSIQ